MIAAGCTRGTAAVGLGARLVRVSPQVRFMRERDDSQFSVEFRSQAAMFPLAESGLRSVSDTRLKRIEGVIVVGIGLGKEVSLKAL
jgi:hypothetical protein